MHAGLTTGEATAVLEANLWSMWSNFGRGQGCRLIDEPEVLRFETPLAHVPYNTVLRFRVEDGVDETIDSVVGSYQARGVPLVWIVHPTARPADLGARLGARGLVEAEVVPGMVASLADIPPADPVPDGIEVTEVGPGEECPFIELVAWRYSLPPEATTTLRSVMTAARFGDPGSSTRAWVAQRDGAVVSKAVLHVGGGEAGIYGVATRPEARGLGLARLLTILALDGARAAGSEIAVLHSTPMAVGLYQGLGFETVADFRLYSMPGTLHL